MTMDREHSTSPEGGHGFADGSSSGDEGKYLYCGPASLERQVRLTVVDSDRAVLKP